MNPKKKVLIISYYWPPSGGSGVQRWVKFCKYLNQFGWEPVVYTPSNPERPALDESLLKEIPNTVEVITQPIWEPYTFYKKFVGINKEEKLGSALMKSGNESSFLQKLSVWVRGNFFIPDARKFWIKPSIKFLKKYLSDHQFDAIVSTGPPHSMHMIAKGIAGKTDLPWMADFRDPWTNIDFFEDLHLSSLARKRHHKLEKSVLDSADKIVVVSPTMKKEFEVVTKTPISVITNGFDSSDFEESIHPDNERFTLSHVGMMTPSRNPEILWKVINELKTEHSEFASGFKLQLIGRIDASVQESIKKYQLEELVDIIDYVPHSEITKYQQNSDALLLIINNTPNANLLLTGKFFEYLAAERPIVCISPLQGDAGEILNQTNSGQLFTYEQKSELKKHLMWLLNNRGKSIKHSHAADIHTYSRESLTEKLARELNSIVL